VRFLNEAISAAVGTEPYKFSLIELGNMAGAERYSDLHDRLFTFFESLKPYREWGDFQMVEELPRPRPLPLLIDPSILYGHFHAWLWDQPGEKDPDLLFTLQHYLKNVN
jgi:hypothetical protein